jgi:hypothetical protein
VQGKAELDPIEAKDTLLPLRVVDISEKVKKNVNCAVIKENFILAIHRVVIIGPPLVKDSFEPAPTGILSKRLLFVPCRVTLLLAQLTQDANGLKVIPCLLLVCPRPQREIFVNKKVARVFS